jgi:general secretion pathway protein A
MGMYEAYFGLREKPFSILPDPKFLYFSRAHSMAFAMLEYGLVNQAGFTVVTGAIGSGKTTLVRRLLDSMGRSMRVGLITQTSKYGGNLLEWVLMAFDQPFEGLSYPSLYKRFCEFVGDCASRGERVVLVIDEAQNLEPARLEELRMLSNINTQAMRLQLILVGQPELRETLQMAELTQFAQRVSSDYHLHELERSDARAYVEHRIMVAGGQPGLFSSQAKSLICEAAHGVPRQINVLADRCLVYAFAKSAGSVSAGIVRKVLADRARHGIFQPNMSLSFLEPAPAPELAQAAG